MKTARFFLFWGAGCLSLVAPRSMWAVDVESVLQKMEQAEREVQTLNFQFSQTADIHVTGEQQKIRGTAYFQRPDRFRIEHKAPAAQTVVSDGKNFWFFNPAQNQVLVDKWENWAQASGFPKGLLPFQSDVRGLREKYAISLEKADKTNSRNGAVLKLSPKEKQPWPYVFKVGVDLETGLPYFTEMETQSVTAVTRVENVKVNPALSEKLFMFEIPEGVEVLESPAKVLR